MPTAKTVIECGTRLAQAPDNQKSAPAFDPKALDKKEQISHDL
jgi:hypothetical protein